MTWSAPWSSAGRSRKPKPTRTLAAPAPRVEDAVADERRAPAAAPGDHRADRLGRGFAAGERVAADDARHAVRKPQFAQQLARRTFGLVGDDGGADPQRVEPVEHVRHAGKDAAVYGDMRFIIGHQLAEERLRASIRDAARRGKTLFQHVQRALSDHRPHLCFRQRRAADQRQRVIDGGGEVAERIDQGAVEVETDDLKRKIVHGRRHGAPLWKPQ